MTRPITLIIGGGVAGLAAGWSLARASIQREVTVLESEALTFSHSSARNAAIFRPLEEHASTTRLAARSTELLRQLGRDTSLVDGRGLLLTARDDCRLDALRRVAAEQGVQHSNLDRAQLERRCALLTGGESEVALHLPQGGVLDVHAIGEHLRKQCRALGVAIRTGTRVVEIVTRGGAVRGVVLDNGQRVPADEVIIAAGAWSRQLGDSCGCPLPLSPHRRHLAQLALDAALDTAPRDVAWSVTSGVYFRREGGGYLACPGDHEPYPASIPPVDPAKLELLARQLPTLAPGLRGARLRRSWACLRTMTPDGEAVVGRDERLEGLFWLTGLGGFGMSGGLAAGELVARAIAGQADAPALRPERLFRAPSPQLTTLANSQPVGRA